MHTRIFTKYIFAFERTKQLYLLSWGAAERAENCCCLSDISWAAKSLPDPLRGGSNSTLLQGCTNGFGSRQPTCWGGRGEHSLSIVLKLSLSAADLGLNLLWIKVGWQEGHLQAKGIGLLLGFQFLFQELFILFYLVAFTGLIRRL